MNNWKPSRIDAFNGGEKHFYEPEPCKRGHVGLRYVKSGSCVACNKAKCSKYHADRYKSDPAFREHKNEIASKWFANTGKQRRSANRERIALADKKWRSNNKPYVQRIVSEWRRANRDKLAKNASFYRASKIKATPPWADHHKIQLVYTEAQNKSAETGVLHAVDHIVPLNGKLVCGLHVDYNLQVITHIDNCSKSNKHQP